MRLILLNWPTHIQPEPDDTMTGDEIKPIMLKFLKGRKGSGDAAELLFRCKRKEMPEFIVTTIKDINRKIKKS